MKQLLAFTLSAVVLCAHAASNDGGTAAKSSAAGASASATAGTKTAPRSAAKGAASAASANQVGVNPRTAGGEQSKGPSRQMKKTEPESNSSQ